MAISGRRIRNYEEMTMAEKVRYNGRVFRKGENVPCYILEFENAAATFNEDALAWCTPEGDCYEVFPNAKALAPDQDLITVRAKEGQAPKFLKASHTIIYGNTVEEIYPDGKKKESPDRDMVDAVRQQIMDQLGLQGTHVDTVTLDEFADMAREAEDNTTTTYRVGNISIGEDGALVVDAFTDIPYPADFVNIDYTLQAETENTRGEVRGMDVRPWTTGGEFVTENIQLPEDVAEVRHFTYEVHPEAIFQDMFDDQTP